PWGWCAINVLDPEVCGLLLLGRQSLTLEPVNAADAAHFRPALLATHDGERRIWETISSQRPPHRNALDCCASWRERCGASIGGGDRQVARQRCYGLEQIFFNFGP